MTFSKENWGNRFSDLISHLHFSPPNPGFPLAPVWFLQGEISKLTALSERMT